MTSGLNAHIGCCRGLQVLPRRQAQGNEQGGGEYQCGPSEKDLVLRTADISAVRRSRGKQYDEWMGAGWGAPSLFRNAPEGVNVSGTVQDR
jgi:hypothetical protein